MARVVSKRTGALPGSIVPLAIALALLVSACLRPAITHYTPEVVGVVADVRDEGPNQVFTLTDGRTVSETAARVRYLLKFPPGVGQLLLAGTKPEPWIARAMDADGTFAEITAAHCFLMAAAATRVGDWIEFDNGLRLPVAKDFDPGLFHGDRFNPATGFCIDPNGEVKTVD